MDEGTRARFTAIHEVGHVFLHLGMPLLRHNRECQSPPVRGQRVGKQTHSLLEFLMPVAVIKQMKRQTARRRADFLGYREPQQSSLIECFEKQRADPKELK